MDQLAQCCFNLIRGLEIVSWIYNYVKYPWGRPLFLFLIVILSNLNKIVSCRRYLWLILIQNNSNNKLARFHLCSNSSNLTALVKKSSEKLYNNTDKFSLPKGKKSSECWNEMWLFIVHGKSILLDTISVVLLLSQL